MRANRSTNRARLIIENEFKLRQSRNPRYSLRAFARDLKTSPSRLIEIVNGKAKISPQRAKTIAPLLFDDPSKIDFFIHTAISENSRSQSNRSKALNKLDTARKIREHFITHAEKIKFFTNWHNLAVFELSKLNGFDGTIHWLLRRSGLPRKIVEQALLGMKALKLATFTSFDTDIRIEKTNFWTDVELTNESVNRLHRDLIHEATRRLSTQSQEKQQIFSSNIVAIDEKNYKFIREKIKNFLSELSLEQDLQQTKNRLYYLGLQFVPIPEKDKLIP